MRTIFNHFSFTLAFVNHFCILRKTACFILPLFMLVETIFLSTGEHFFDFSSILAKGNLVESIIDLVESIFFHFFLFLVLETISFIFYDILSISISIFSSIKSYSFISHLLLVLETISLSSGKRKHFQSFLIYSC